MHICTLYYICQLLPVAHFPKTTDKIKGQVYFPQHTYWLFIKLYIGLKMVDIFVSESNQFIFLRY